MLFDKEELESWLKQGRIGTDAEPALAMPSAIHLHQTRQSGMTFVDISSGPVYHRNSRYR
jgi:hypothetical protein